jgi:hypothetical protein
MREYPMTFDEFVKQFNTEEQCRDYLYHLRWPDGFTCPHCKGAEYWPINDNLYECRMCKRQTSVTAGTMFQDTRMPLRTWFIAKTFSNTYTANFMATTKPKNKLKETNSSIQHKANVLCMCVCVHSQRGYIDTVFLGP